MEQGLGSESTPVSASDEKSRVLNVRPLRCLVPIFTSPPGTSSVSSSQASPFVCVPPTGPFPPGVSSVFPFLVPSEHQNPQNPFDASSSQAGPSVGVNNNSSFPSPVPISSFRTPTLQANGNTRSSKRSLRENSQRKTRSDDMITHDVNIDKVANDFLASFCSMRIDETRQSDGDKEVVGYIITTYNFLRRRLSQVEGYVEATPGITRRPDLRAGTILMNKKGIRTNMTKRVGAVPGVEVGDIYFFRVEMCLVGLHAPIMGGIDYMSFKMSLDEEPVAVSIVSSGSYEDNDEDGEVLIYSGQGGVLRRDKDVSDQKLERGNLALEKSLHRGNDVRVIRGVRDEASSTKTAKVYLYDGLYKILESWVEKDKSGCNVFKYRLVRGAGQPEAFTLWKSIQQWKNDVTSRVGVILPDLTSGAERLPVCLVNDVDDEKGPAHFTYFRTLKYPKSVDSPQPSFICTCRGGCQPNDLNCPCIQKHGGVLPFTLLGVLLSFKTLIYECGPSCLCPLDCRNRVSQAGLKVNLEVFRTTDKGWGLRSWDPIRSGAFICEYAGEVLDKSRVEQLGSDNQDNYIFDASRTFEPVELMSGYSAESQNIPSPLVISAKEGGNVARFMNHSCAPNVYWQPVLRGESNLHIAFFAISHIPPMKELTYDYGIVQSGKPEPRKKKCLCVSLKCRGYYY